MRVWLFFSTLLLCLTAYAHTPVCRCSLTDNQVICEGRFHDGSEAVGTPMTVISYQEQEIAHGELDKDSRFRVPLPDQAFYILMDAGPGEMVEVDWRDIQGIGKTRFRAP